MRSDDEDVHPDAAASPGYLTIHIARRYTRQVDDALRPHGMSMALVGPLLWLSWRGPMLQRDIVKLSAIRQPTLAVLLDKLEKGGLIRRHAVPGERRAVMIHITAEGEEKAEIGRVVFTRMTERTVKGFEARERRQLTSMLWRVVANLDEPPGS